MDGCLYKGQHCVATRLFAQYLETEDLQKLCLWDSRFVGMGGFLVKVRERYGRNRNRQEPGCWFLLVMDLWKQ